MTLRSLLMLAVLVATGALLAGQVRQLLADPTVWPPDDFVEYWAAAKLTLDGQNPFDESLLLPLQRDAGRDTPDAVMMWNPPWALPVVLPLGLFSARAAQLLWLLVHLVVTGFCADRLWLMLGGNRARRWVGWVAAFVFMPTAFALSTGQISPLLLLGAVLFLECERRNRRDRLWEYAAGAATILVAIKPHLAYLLWLGIAVDAVLRGRWRILAGGAVAGAVFALLPLAFNPQVWNQYADALGNRPPAQWLSPTFGSVLRLVFGAEQFRLQFVSVAVGLVWFAWYRWDKRDGWNWTDQLPLVLLVSFVTAPYGAWPFDMVLLLPAAFVLLVGKQPTIKSETNWEKAEDRNLAPPSFVGKGVGGVGYEDPSPTPPPRGEGLQIPAVSPASFLGKGAGGLGSYSFALAGLMGINLGCLVMNLCQTGSFPFIWVSPTLLVLYSLRMESARVRQARHSEKPVAVPA